MSDANETTETRAPGQSVRTPPYVSFQTFLTLVEDLKTNGLPQKIDRSVLKRFSGGVGSQLLLAIRSLALVDSDDKPTPALKQLVETFGTEDFKGALRPVIDATYPFLVDLDLTTMTPSMFADIFKTNTNAKEDVLRKCRTFFLHVARYVGIDVGQRLGSGGAPRASSNGPGRRRKAGRPKEDGATAQPEGQPVHHARRHRSESTLQEKLLEKFPKFDPSWPDELKSKWFDGFEKFMRTATNESGDRH